LPSDFSDNGLTICGEEAVGSTDCEGRRAGHAGVKEIAASHCMGYDRHDHSLSKDASVTPL